MVPKHHRASAVIAGWNGAFETAVIERMILNFDRETPVAAFHGKPFGNGPRFQNAFHLQSKIVMQMARGMFLDDELQPFFFARRDFARRLAGLPKIAFAFVFFKAHEIEPLNPVGTARRAVRGHRSAMSLPKHSLSSSLHLRSSVSIGG